MVNGSSAALVSETLGQYNWSGSEIWRDDVNLLINCDQIREIQSGNDVCKNLPEWFSIALNKSPFRDVTNGR